MIAHKTIAYKLEVVFQKRDCNVINSCDEILIIGEQDIFLKSQGANVVITFHKCPALFSSSGNILTQLTAQHKYLSKFYINHHIQPRFRHNFLFFIRISFFRRCIFTICFSVFMVLGRLISGVHWLTDIVGSLMLSAGLFCIYKSVVLLCYKGKNG